MENTQLNTSIRPLQLTPSLAWDIFLREDISKHFYYIHPDIKKYLMGESPIPYRASPYFPTISSTMSVPDYAKQYEQLENYAGGILGIIKFVIECKHAIKNGWYISPSTKHNRVPALQKDTKGFWLYLGDQGLLKNHIGDKLILYEEYHIIT